MVHFSEHLSFALVLFEVRPQCKVNLSSHRFDKVYRQILDFVKWMLLLGYSKRQKKSISLVRSIPIPINDMGFGKRIW